MANWISYIKDDLGTGGTTRDGMISDGPSHGVQLSQELPPLVGFTTIGSAGTLHVAGTLKLDGQLKDGDNAFGTSGQVLSSDGTDTKWVSSGSLAAGAASQVAINDDGDTNASRFITFVDSSSGNNNVKTDSVIKYNPSTNLLNLNATASGIKFGPGEAANDDAHIEWLGGSNAGHLRISTSDDGGSEYIQFGDYDHLDRGGTFSEWLRISRSTGTFTGTFSATTFSGSGASLTSLNATNISSGTINAARVPTLNQNTTGSAATLTTARNIGGVSFDGSAAINLPGVNEAGNQNTSGNAATATVLATARNFSISGDITANAISFNGNGNVALSATIDNNAVDKNCMANEAVGEPELHISNSGTNGQFLQKSSNSGGLTWADVTIPSASTLSGSTLASGVTASSITSLGTLTGLTVSGTVTLASKNEDPSHDKGVINIQPSTSGGRTGITLRSKVNPNSDHGYLWWYDDNDNYNLSGSSNTENGALVIGINNDATSSAAQDNVAVESTGNIFLNPGINDNSFGGASGPDFSRGKVYIGRGSTKYEMYHANNLTVGDGGLTQKNFTTTLKSKLDGIANAANNYTHPSYNGDDFSIDTGHLSGATVIDDLDINVTTDSSGHVTDCNATVATRNLTLANLGFSGASNANYITNTNQLTNGAGFITSALTGNSKVTIKTSGSGTHTTQSWCKIMVAAFVGGGGGGGSSSAYHDDDDPSTYGAGGAGGTGGVKFKVATPNGSSGYSYSVGGGGGTAGGGGNTSFGGSTAGGGGGGSNAGSSGNAGGGSGGSGDIPGRSGGTGKSNNKNQYSPFWGAYGSNGYGRYGTENGPTSGIGGCIIILELG